MNRHLRDDHSEPSVQTSDSSEVKLIKDLGTENIKGIERTVEIPQQPSIGGPRKANSIAFCPTVLRLMSMSVVRLSTCKIATHM